jgi:hypothetical protein
VQQELKTIMGVDAIVDVEVVLVKGAKSSW